MKIGKLTLLLPALTLLAGCPGDDTSSTDTTVGNDSTGGDDDGVVTTVPVTTSPTSGMPDTGDTSAPDTGTPDTGMPDTGMPDTGDTGMTDTGTPTSGTDTGTGTGTDTGTGTGTGTESGGTTAGIGDCTLVTPGQLVGGNGLFSFTDEFIGIVDPDQLRFEFYTPDTGMFDLTSVGVNDNYISCEQCVRVFQDPMTDPLVQYFQSEGSITVSDESAVQGGTLEVTTDGVVLVEVTIANDFTSTPVVDGACVVIADGTYSNLIAGWNCDPDFYDDGSCDCGCGIADPDCADATAGSCEFCNDLGSCDITGGGCPGIIDPVDNSTCDTTPPAEWTCAAGAYADGTCDCGCGALDALDCDDELPASCDECNGVGSCAEDGNDCSTISGNNNANCANGACTSSSNAGDIDGADPTFNRPLSAGLGCSLSGVGTDVSYDVYTFTASGGSTDVTLSTCNTADFDSVLLVYQAGDGSADPFDPLNPCANSIAYNDDNAGAGCAGGTSSLDVTGLVDGDYQVVVTTFNNAETGAYTLDATCN